MFARMGPSPSWEMKTPRFPAEDILGTTIALNKENKGLLMPSAGFEFPARLGKFSSWQSCVVMGPGLNDGTTWNTSVHLLSVLLIFIL